jgi:hypothetical protein
MMRNGLLINTGLGIWKASGASYLPCMAFPRMFWYKSSNLEEECHRAKIRGTGEGGLRKGWERVEGR